MTDSEQENRRAGPWRMPFADDGSGDGQANWFPDCGTHWGAGLFKPDAPHRLTVVSAGNVMTFSICGHGRDERFEWMSRSFHRAPRGASGCASCPSVYPG